MRAMVLRGPGLSLEARELPDPRPGPGEVLVRVKACGVCRTDLHVADGELTQPRLPLVLGHEIVGEVVQGGSLHAAGARVGIPWLGWTCGECSYCRSGRENLCVRAQFTGYQRDGGYSQLPGADERVCFALPDRDGDVDAPPPPCAR